MTDSNSKNNFIIFILDIFRFEGGIMDSPFFDHKYPPITCLPTRGLAVMSKPLKIFWF